MTMRGLSLTLGSLIVICGVTGQIARAESKPHLISYQKDSGAGLGAFGGKLLHSYGYKDKRLEGGVWQITAQARSDRPEDSQSIAIYRAAEIATSEKKRFIHVLRVNGRQLSAVFAGATATTTTTTTFSGSGISYGTRYMVDFELTDVADSAACTSDVLKPTCATIDAAAAMQEIHPRLKMS